MILVVMIFGIKLTQTELFFANVTFYDGLVTTEYVDQYIFDIPGLEGYWWQMTSNGVKIMQVRFYPVFR